MSVDPISWGEWRSSKIDGEQRDVDIRDAAIRYGLSIGPVASACLCALLDGDKSWKELAVAVNSHRPAKMGAVHEALSTLRKRYGDTIIGTGPRSAGSKYRLTWDGRALCLWAIGRAQAELDALKNVTDGR